MSIFNFGQVFSDPVEREWLVYDPLSEAFFGSASQNAGGGFRKNYSPLLTADLIGFENEYRVYADLPGVQPEDVDVSVDDRFLVIQAERKQCHNTETDKIIRLERQDIYLGIYRFDSSSNSTSSARELYIRVDGGNNQCILLGLNTDSNNANTRDPDGTISTAPIEIEEIPFDKIKKIM